MDQRTDSARPKALAVFARCHAEQLPELTSEVTLVHEAVCCSDPRDGHVGRGQIVGSRAHPKLPDERAYRATVMHPESAPEVGRVYTRLTSECNERKDFTGTVRQAGVHMLQPGRWQVRVARAGTAPRQDSKKFERERCGGQRRHVVRVVELQRQSSSQALGVHVAEESDGRPERPSRVKNFRVRIVGLDDDLRGA